MNKLMENFKVNYDQTVRDASGNILQFQYGDDGFDGVRIVRLTIPELLEGWNRWELNHEDEQAVIAEHNSLNSSQNYLKRWQGEHGEKLVSCPVDVEALFERAKILSEGQQMKWGVSYVYNRCLQVLCRIENKLFQNYLTLFLQIRRMQELNEVFFEWFLNTVQEQYDKAQVAPGEMVGVLAGQSKCSQKVRLSFSVQGPHVRKAQKGQKGQKGQNQNLEKKSDFRFLSRVPMYGKHRKGRKGRKGRTDPTLCFCCSYRY